jgi:hypothetical protein
MKMWYHLRGGPGLAPFESYARSKFTGGSRPQH